MAGGEARVPLFCRNETYDGDTLSSVSYLAQWFDGDYLKCAQITFTDGEGGVYAQTTDAKYIGSGMDAAYGTDFSGGTAGYVADSSSASGYGFHSLKSLAASDLKSININFNRQEATKVTPRLATDPVGPGDYAVAAAVWTQITQEQSTDTVTKKGVTALGDDGADIFAVANSTVTISGSRGSWSNSGYTSSSDVRFGYVDDATSYPAPTITVTNIPFDYYKVVFIPSTDTENVQFGYITVNGTNYTSDNTEKADDKDYETITGVASWGKSLVTDYLQGVNYLVTPVLANNSTKSLTVTGHRNGDSVRGCIAAIQIVKADAPDTLYSVVATGDVTWSTKAGLSVASGTWASGNTIMLANNLAEPVTVTFDEEVEAAELILSGSGTTKIAFANAAYNKIGSFNFSDVAGEVSIDDAVPTSSIEALPVSGELRFAGAAVLDAIPFNGAVADGAYIIDQDMKSGMDFLLEGKKGLVVFDGDHDWSFERFVIANSASVQNVEQRGGAITVTGNTAPYSNQASVFFGHYSGSTATMNTLGGTFTATSAAASLGWDGAFTWTIGDGESADGTATVTLSGIVSGGTRGGYTRTRNATLVLNKGGTLNIGASGIQMISGNRSDLTLAGGKLVAAADTYAMNTSSGSTVLSSGTATAIDTGAYTFTVSNVLSGAGNLAKTGNGTLVLASAATATGTLTVSEGTLELSSGVTWAGTIAVGENGILNIADGSIDAESTVYIPVGGSLTVAEGAIVKLNGVAIDADVWELSGGTFVNKTLKTAVTTAEGDFAFSTANWESALGAGTQIDWAGSLSELRVKAGNAEPAVATVDVNAADVQNFVAEGSGDLTFVAAAGGFIAASAYDFSAAAGRVQYDLPTGEAPVISGSNTLLLGGGSGEPAVAAGQTLTLGPWGTVDETGLTNTYSTILRPATGATLVFSPGEGKVQKTAGFGGANTATTIAVTNGTLSVDLQGGGESLYFGSNTVRIDNGGILNLDAQDALGYTYTRELTINKGGVLAVNVRDTLRRTMTMNGGKIEIRNVNGGRGLDFFGLAFKVLDDSSIDQLEELSTIGLRSADTTIDLNDSKTLAINANIYQQESNCGLLVRAASGQPNQNGVVQLNGYSGAPKMSCTGTIYVGDPNSALPAVVELNCEHTNGVYAVSARSRFRGTGSVTGDGGVTLAAANSKICGSLAINKLTAASGGMFGDQWNVVSAKVVDSLTTEGTLAIQNGSFTIGADCDVSGASASSVSVAADGCFGIEKDLTVAGVTVVAGGSIRLAADRRGGAALLTVSGTFAQGGAMSVVLDYGSGSIPSHGKIPLIAASGIDVDNVTVSDNSGVVWNVVYEDGVLYGVLNGGFSVKVR